MRPRNSVGIIRIVRPSDASILKPSYQGSCSLHELLPKDTDCMVFLSSISGIIGNPTQASYAASNTFEDSLARHRAANGMKGVSFDLGWVLEAGWANENFEDVTKSLRAGLGGLTQAQLVAILDVLCNPAYDCTSDLGAAQVVNTHVRPSKLYGMFQDDVLHWFGKPLFRNLLRPGQVEVVNSWGAQDETMAVDYLALIGAASDAEEAAHIVIQAFLGKLSKSPSVLAVSLGVDKPAYVLDVDFLIAVELRYRFLKQFGVEFPVFSILKNQPTIELCRHMVDQVLASWR